MSNKSFQEIQEILSAASEVFGEAVENQVSIIHEETKRKILSEDKPFDITQHKWSDVIAEIEAEVGDTLVLKFHGSWVSFDRDDAIAIAKHFKLKAEDLA